MRRAAICLPIMLIAGCGLPIAQPGTKWTVTKDMELLDTPKGAPPPPIVWPRLVEAGETLVVAHDPGPRSDTKREVRVRIVEWKSGVRTGYVSRDLIVPIPGQ